MSELRPYEFRKDGWPLCPQCGEDELYHVRNTDPLKGCNYAQQKLGIGKNQHQKIILINFIVIGTLSTKRNPNFNGTKILGYGCMSSKEYDPD